MSTEDQTPPARSGCPMWVKALLVVSLVANVAVAGMFAGAAMKHDKRGHGGARQVEWILKFVPEERRDEAEALFESRRKELRELHRDSMDDMTAIVEAIRAEPFSPETLDSALTTRRASRMARDEIVQGGLVELMQSFSAEERKVFADRLQERLDRWKKKRQQGDD